MPTTPTEWLPVLAARLDQLHQAGAAFPGDEYPGIDRLRRYAHGRADLPEMGKNVRASWEAFQAKARRDYGGIAVRSLAARCVFNGLRIGTSNDNVALVQARRILRDNRADKQFAQAIRDMLETRWGYLVVGRDAAGAAVITREVPEQFYAITDPLRPWKAVAALKVWRDDISSVDHARVWVAGEVQLFTRSSRNEHGSVRTTASGTDWALDGEPEVYDGDPPIVILERELAHLEPHLGLIDGMILGKLNRLVITAMQAFRQRALKRTAGSGDLESEDEDGNDVDLAKALEPAPGALWDLPEGIDIWESKPTEIHPLIDGETQDAKDFSASTGTPLAALLPDSQNQAAAGVDAAKEAQVSEAETITREISPALAVLMVYALRAEGVDLGDDTVEILWVPPAHVSLSEKYDAATKAKAAGRSRRGILRDILGLSPDQIAEEERDLADEQLELALSGVVTGDPAAKP